MKRIWDIFGHGGAISTSKSITFTGLNYEVEIKKDRYYYKDFQQKWYHNFYLKFVIFAVAEIIFYYKTGLSILNPRFFIFAPIITILILFSYTCVFSDSKSLRMNHGAEHKVLNAFLNNDLENADKYSRFSNGCGSNTSLIIIISIFLSPIIKLPFTFLLISLILYDCSHSVRYIFFNSIGKVSQYFLTLEPTKEVLDHARKGFENLIQMEIEKSRYEKSEMKNNKTSENIWKYIRKKVR